MGTRFEIVLAGGAAARAVGEEAIREIDDLDRRWSLFRRDSLVSFINANAAERAVRLDADTFELLELAEWIRVESRGLFDICIGAAMARWGFRSEAPGAAVEGSANDGSSAQLDPSDQTVRFARRGVSLDLGGIAKGYAIDSAIRILRRHGVTCALVHGGTSCIGAIGAPPDTPGWRVAIAGGGPVVTLRDGCLAVSAPSGREIERDGERFGHVMDPRTGAPADCARAAAVIGPVAAACDAWAKPALIERRRPRALPPEFTSVIDRALSGPADWAIDGPHAGSITP